MSEIVITGMGICTALGGDVDSNRKALLAGKSGIGHLEMFPSRYAGLLPCGEIKIGDRELRTKCNVQEPGVTRTTMLAFLAMEEAIRDAGLGKAILAERGTALVNATTVGGMCMTDELYHDANLIAPFSEYLSSYDCGSVALYLQHRFGIGGIINTINTACSSSANSIAYGARLLKNGLARRVIVGGVDSLAKFTINGFNALRILSSERCTPFDQDRKGLNLGEGAAFLVMEKASDLGKGARVLARCTGYGNANDAYHPSSLSVEGDGPWMAMQKALDLAGIQPGDVSFINAHGTATENNDEVESQAMLRLFGSAIPPFASTKAFTGHTLGAAGAVEAVFSILSLVHGEVYPNLNFVNAIPGMNLVPVLDVKRMDLTHVMSNSFGFGGNCSSLIFSKA